MEQILPEQDINRVYPNAIDFLQRVFGPDPLLETCNPQQVKDLTETLLATDSGAYRAPNQYWRDIAERQRKLVTLYTRGMPESEIAQQTGFALHTFDLRINTVVKRIRKAYSPPYYSSLSAKLDGSVDVINRWMVARQEHRQLLFGEAGADDGVITSLADIALQTSIQNSGTKNYYRDEGAKSELAARVVAILRYHDKLAFDSHESKAIFGTASQEALDRIASLASRAIWLWDQSCRQIAKPSPFADLPATNIEDNDFGRQDVQLVLEAAAAASEILQLGYKGGTPWSKTSNKLGNFIARRGPAFAEAWINGDTIRAFCEENGLDAETWLGHISPSLRASIAMGSSLNPQGKLRSIVTGFEQTLSIKNLKTLTGWPEEKVRTAFPDSTRIVLALNNRKPEAKVLDWVSQLETTLSTANIAERVGWPEARVDTYFSLAERRQRLEAYADPLRAIERAANRLDILDHKTLSHILGWSEKEVAQVFTPSIVQAIAKRDDQDVVDAARRMGHNFTVELSPDKLVDAIGMSEKQTARIFPAWIRRHLALRAGADPVSAAKAHAGLSRSLMREYSLSAEISSRLALRSPGKARAIAEQVRLQKDDRPSDVSELLWAWAVAKTPRGDHAKRLRHIAAYKLWRSVSNQPVGKRPLPFHLIGSVEFDDHTFNNEISYGQTAGTFDPFDSIEDVELGPSDYLQGLATKAGIPVEALTKLLDHFEAPVASNGDSAEVDALVATLRRAAATEA